MGRKIAEQYGPWALIAGGAQGIGRAWAERLAEEGLNLLVLDREAQLLHNACRDIAAAHDVSCEPLVADLANPDVLASVTAAVGEREVGLLVYNAAMADVGPFYKQQGSLENELIKAQVNMLSPLSMVYHFAKPMLARKRGGIVLMSSGSGFQGAPYYAHYAATKAYSIVLAESLCFEFKPYHVDVLACVAGMTLSPAVAAAVERGEGQHSVYQTPEEVVEEGLAALGREPSHVCGVHNRDNQSQLNSLPREQAITAISQHAVRNFLDDKTPTQLLD